MVSLPHLLCPSPFIPLCMRGGDISERWFGDFELCDNSNYEVSLFLFVEMRARVCVCA